MKKSIGLFFGSFNPIHIGHLIIANHLVEHSSLQEVWFVVTPQNPFKEKKTLLDNQERLEMVHRAVKKYDKLRECDIEFALKQPNYTIDTLKVLEKKYPKYHFSLIMGEDNLKSLHKWKAYEEILEKYLIYVYPRLSEEAPAPPEIANHLHIKRIEAPIIELSATFIREEITKKRNVTPLLPQEVWEYIDKMGFYS